MEYQKLIASDVIQEGDEYNISLSNPIWNKFEKRYFGLSAYIYLKIADIRRPIKKDDIIL